MRKLIMLINLIFLFLFNSYVLSAEKVVVIPLNIQKKLKQVVTVAKNGGDFNCPIMAIDSITDASADNPYLIVIAPGIYNLSQQLVMKQFVSITGSGPNSTKLTSPGPLGCLEGASAALICAVNNTSLSSLTIENLGQKSGCNYSNVSVGIESINSSPSIIDVIIKAYGGTDQNVGIYNNNNSSAKLENLEIYAVGGMQTYGIEINNSSPKLYNTSIFVSEGTNGNSGVQIYKSFPEITNVSVQTKGSNTLASSCEGVVIYDSSPILNSVLIKSTGCQYNYGVLTNTETSGSSSPTFQNSTIEGQSSGAYALASGTWRFVNSSIIGGINATSICLNSNNGINSEFNQSCTEVTP